jgi:hypothetical protein
MPDRRLVVSGRLVFGLVLLTLGILWTLDNLDLFESEAFVRWWPAVIIAWGLLRVTGLDGCRRPLAGVLLTLAGAVLLLTNLDLIDVSIWHLWPVALVIVGAGVVLRSLRAGAPAGESSDQASTLRTFAFLSGHKVRSQSEDFRGGEISAVAGGGDIDLRQVRTSQPRIELDLLVWWGGFDILVPRDWRIVPEATVLMGGLVDSTRPAEGEPRTTLVLRGLIIMGGVEVKN